MVVRIEAHGGGADDERKRRRGGRPQAPPSPDPGTDFYGEPGFVSRTVTNLALVEKASGGKLPAALSYSLSTVDMEARRLRKIAKIAARQLDVPPAFLWGDKQIAKMTDPLYGGPMRMSTLNRITEGLEPVLLQGMLPGLLGDVPRRPGEPVRRRGEGLAQVNPKAMSRAVRALAKLADDYDMTAPEGLSFAAGVARDKVDPKLAANNIRAVQQYDRAFSRDQVIGVAMEATKAGVAFDSVDSIVGFITPRALQERAKADEHIESLKLMYGEDWEAFVPANLREERLAEAARASANVDLATYARAGKNYMAEAGVIEEELRADEEAWQNSFVGRNLTGALDKWNRLYTNIERGLVTISTPIIGGLVEGGIPGFDSTGWGDAFRWRDERFKDFAQGKHIGQQFVEETGAPEWMGVPIDLALGWFLDPLVFVGKAATILRAGRVAPGLLDKTTLLRSVAQKVNLPISPTSKLGSASSYLKAVDQEAFSATGRLAHGEKLFAALRKSEDDYIRQVSTRYVSNFEARTAYDLPFMTALGRKVRAGLDDGSLSPVKARQEFGIGIMAQRGLQVRPDSIAAEVMQARAVADETVFRSFAKEAPGLQQRLFDPTDSNILTPDATYAEIAEDVILNRTNPISTRLEVPTRLKPVPGLGASRLAGRALKESDSRLARAVAAPFEIPAGNFLKIHQDPPNQFEKVMRDWGGGVFDATRIRQTKAEVAALVQKGGFERQVISKLDEINAEAFTSYATKKGIPKEMVESLRSEVTGQQALVNKKQSFGVLNDRTSLPEPILETQLVNEYFFVNPHDAKQLVDRYTSSVFNMKNAYHTIPGISKSIDDARDAAIAAAKATATKPSIRPKRLTGRKRVTPPDLDGAELAARATPGDAEGYVYHITSPQNFDAIVKQGLTPKQSFYGLAEKMVPPEMRRGRVFFADSIDRAVDLAPGGGDEFVAFRVRAADVGDTVPERLFTGSQFGFEGVGPRRLEFLGADDVWRPAFSDLPSAPGALKAAGNKAAKKAADAQFSKMTTPQIYRAFDKSGEIMRGITRLWKFSAVPRPGYIGRVILGDENLRFLATTGSMFERAAATHLDDATAALLRGYITAPGIATVPKVAANFAGRGTDLTAGKVLDALYPDEINTIRAPDGTITELATQRPGRWDYEPMANTTWRETEIIDNVVREAKSFENLARSEHFGKIMPNDPQYYQLWAHNLTNQLGHSVPGGVALHSVAAGDSIAQTATHLRAWGGANFSTLRGRIGVDDVDQWADDLSKLTHAYTMGEKQIALAAAGRSDNLEDMLRLPNWGAAKPPIHGPLLANLTGGGSGLSLRKYVDYWYDVFVRQPENVLNRQPYYAVWKSRAQRAYTELGGGKASAEGVEAASREFALAQTKRIMFDFSENTRLGESIGAIIPFLQPFLEQYSVWGHILVHRNPALAGYAHQLGRAGVESGFLRNDPTTGELMVPTSWWMEQSLLYNWVTGTKGTATFTPLSSLNLFFSTTMKTPTSGPLGAVLGGAEVPLPGLSPWAGEVLRQVFKGTKNPQIASYLFAWGPNTPILPGSWSKILQAVEPGLYEPGLLESYEKRLATEYQDSGLTDQWKAELSEGDTDPREVAAIIQERIQNKARQMLALNGFMQMFQLGATKVDLSVAAKERDFVQMLKEDGDYASASERFLVKYPNNSLVPTSTTSPSAAMRDLEGNIIYDEQTGQPITIGYRIPSSELAQRLINEDPEMRKTFNQYPELFGGLLLSLDPKLANKYDPSIGAQIIRDGLIKQKDLGRFLADGEGSGPEGFWEAVDDIENAFDIATAGKDEDSRAYTEADRLKQEAYLHVWSQFPFYAPTRLQPVIENDQVVGAQFGYQGEDATNPRAVAKLRAFGEIPGLQDFDMAKAINLYFEGGDDVTGRDELMAEMQKRGIADITTASATDAGLTAKYETLKTAVEAQFPDGAYVIMQILDNDLQRVGNAADKALDTWAKANDQRYAAFKDYDHKYQKLYNTKIDGERDYDAIRALVNGTMQTPQGRKLVQLHFERKAFYEQESYKQTLTTLPVTFYSRFDFSLMGVDMKNPEAKAFQGVQDFQAAERTRQAAAQAQGRVYAMDYDKINQMAREALKKHPGLGSVFNAVNQWGWTLRQQELDKQPGKLGKAWERVFKSMDYSQSDTARYDLNGYHRYVSDEDLAYWREHQAWLRSVVNEYKQQIPAFRRQWDEMDDNYFTGSLYDILMPDTYFKLGGG